MRRRFRLRHRAIKSERLDLELSHGSLLIMGALQHHWRHGVPEKGVREARIAPFSRWYTHLCRPLQEGKQHVTQVQGCAFRWTGIDGGVRLVEFGALPVVDDVDFSLPEDPPETRDKLARWGVASTVRRLYIGTPRGRIPAILDHSIPSEHAVRTIFMSIPSSFRQSS